MSAGRRGDEEEDGKQPWWVPAVLVMATQRLAWHPPGKASPHVCTGRREPA